MKEFRTPEQRCELGQARRKQLKRQEHSVWRPKDRRFDPMKLLQESMRGRVPWLVPVIYERMAASSFNFFRGAVPIMAADLASLPNTGILNQICGDAHVRNLGAYAAPDGSLVFDINDFDETTCGPFEWDLKRLATSLVIAGREVGGKASANRAAVLALAAQYRKSVRLFAQMPAIALARYHVHGIDRVVPISKVLLKAERATPVLSLEKLTVVVNDSASGEQKRIFRDEKPALFRVPASQARLVLDSLHHYRENLLPDRQHLFAQYRPIDVAFKIVGTGSVGWRDYVVYFEGNGPMDPLFLQIKEEPESAYARYLDPAGVGADHAGGHEGRRVALGQRAMQFQSDPFLGWTNIGQRDFLVRQLNDHKGSIDVTDLAGDGLLQYASVCGQLLARGHSRSGDPCLLSGYLGPGPKFDEALADFASAYADQTEADWKTMCKWKHLDKGEAGSPTPVKSSKKSRK